VWEARRDGPESVDDSPVWDGSKLRTEPDRPVEERASGTGSGTSTGTEGDEGADASFGGELPVAGAKVTI